MKRLIIIIVLLLTLIFCSCERTPASYSNGRYKPEKIERYHKGDIVYLKPDSIKAVVLKKQRCGCDVDEYVVYYFTKNGERVEWQVSEELMFLR